MPDMSEKAEGPLFAAAKRFWDFLNHFGNLQTLFQLFVSSGITAVVGKVMPLSWQSPTPLPWFVMGAVFTGSWFVVAAIAQVVIPRFKRWRFPHSLNIIA